MKLCVTQEDIDLARHRYSIWHPFYLAIHRQTGQSWAYHDGYLWPICGEPVAVPLEMKQWAYSYLLCKPVYPEEFEIDLPVQEGCGRKRVVRETFFGVVN